MLKRTKILALACRVLGGAATRPARAQTPADTAALARATATFLADSVLPRIRSVVIWQEHPVPFNAAVAENLRGNVRLSRRAADPEHALHVGIREMRMDSDSAHVVVEIVQEYPNGTADIDSYDNVFARTADGWRFVRAQWVDSAYAGAVRGR